MDAYGAHWNKHSELTSGAVLLLRSFFSPPFGLDLHPFTGHLWDSYQWRGRGTFIYLFFKFPFITCYVSCVENTWRKVYSGIQSEGTGHLLLKLQPPYFPPFLFNP